MNPAPFPTQVVPARRAPAAAPTPGSSLQAEDFAYAFFRHRWKILTITLLGFSAGIALWFLGGRQYESAAKVMVRYVVEAQAAGTVDASDQIIRPDARGSGVINAEIELLTSSDLAVEVAAVVGATNLVPSAVGALGDGLAAQAVAGGLVVKPVPQSSVIEVTFRHPDPKVAREVVKTLIERYLRLHARVHGAVDQLEDLSQQSDRKRARVQAAETELQALKTELGLTAPLAESLKALAAQESTLTLDLLSTESQLAEIQASLPALAAAATNAIAATPANAETNRPVAASALPDPAVVEAYKVISIRLGGLRTKENALLAEYSTNSRFVAPITAQVAGLEKDRNAMIATHPGLTNLVVAGEGNGAGPVPRSAAIVQSDEAVRLYASRLAALSSLEAKRATLRRQVETNHARAVLLSSREVALAQAQREWDEANKQYEYFSTALERARAQETVDKTRLANISVIESASSAYPAKDKLKKIVLGILAASPVAGFGLVFLWEFFGDPTLRRRKHVIDRLKLPLLLSVPRLRLGALQLDKPESGANPISDAGTPVQASELTPYAEALRDRIIMQFQARELHHKPKMIGVTSCGGKTGVTSVATALAAALSETGEGKVLYIDVNAATGPSVHPFQRGREVGRIQDALAEDQRQSAMVSDQLYVVSLGGELGHRVGVIPKTLSDLVPRIKASDYDYIIFDLPPITQTSITARVAGLLDMNVLVLESEKTLLGRAEQAVRLLAESNSQMVAVLNKHRRYLPARLDSDL